MEIVLNVAIVLTFYTVLDHIHHTKPLTLYIIILWTQWTNISIPRYTITKLFVVAQSTIKQSKQNSQFPQTKSI